MVENYCKEEPLEDMDEGSGTYITIIGSDWWCSKARCNEDTNIGSPADPHNHHQHRGRCCNPPARHNQLRKKILAARRWRQAEAARSAAEPANAQDDHRIVTAPFLWRNIRKFILVRYFNPEKEQKQTFQCECHQEHEHGIHHEPHDQPESMLGLSVQQNTSLSTCSGQAQEGERCECCRSKHLTSPEKSSRFAHQSQNLLRAHVHWNGDAYFSSQYWFPEPADSLAMMMLVHDVGKDCQMDSMSEALVTTTAGWSQSEVLQFIFALAKFGKNLPRIAKVLPTKSYPQVVDFYYKNKKRNMFLVGLRKRLKQRPPPPSRWSPFHPVARPRRSAVAPADPLTEISDTPLSSEACWWSRYPVPKTTVVVFDRPSSLRSGKSLQKKRPSGKPPYRVDLIGEALAGRRRQQQWDDDIALGSGSCQVLTSSEDFWESLDPLGTWREIYRAKTSVPINDIETNAYTS